MNWLIIIIIAAIVCGIIGAALSKSGDEKGGCLAGALTGGLGCGYVIFQIFLAGIGIFILFKVFTFLFG